MSAVCAAAMLTAAAATPARAEGPGNSRTEFTFNKPVELPNVTLPPGTYIFRLAEATPGRTVMQVQAKDAANKMYGIFFTTPARRPRASRQPELRFIETPAGKPVAVRTWWYPGHTTGREFIYPKVQARRLAQTTTQPVLTTRAETMTAGEVEPDALVYISPTGREVPAAESRQSSSRASSATGDEPAQEATEARASLPDTGTSLPGVGLMGLISFAGAAVLRLRT